MKKIIFFIGCFFLIMDTTMAIALSCPEVASPGEIINLHIEEQEFNGIKAKYQFDSGFVYQNMKITSPWKSYYNGMNGFSIGNATNQDKLSMDINVKIDMNVDVNKDYSLQLIELEASNVDYKSVEVDDVGCKIKVLSNINTLDSLTVDGLSLNPKFDKNVISYDATTKKDKVVIKATSSDSDAKVEGSIGEQKLNYGVNNFVIKVTSARGTVREYKLYITRTFDKVNTSTNNKSNDATLKSLSISTGKIDLKKDVFLYSVDVSYEVEEIEVNAVVNHEKAKVEVQKPDKLVLGENTIKVIVTAEDGTTATYIIIINKKDKLSNDATIKSLNIKNYDISFKSDIYEYQLEIDNEDKLDIEVILNDDKASYKIKGNKNLINGSVIEIEVTAEDGSTSTYKINISKLNENTSNSIVNYVKFIPLIGFVLLIIGVLVVKVLKSKFVKN